MLRVFSVQFFLLLFSTASFAQKPVTVSSPDRRLTYSFRLNNSTASYSVSFRNEPIIRNSAVGFKFKDGNAFANMRQQKVSTRRGKEEYDLPIGKVSHVSDEYNELVIPIKSGDTQISVVVRAFNDGIAFRYEFMNSKGDSLILTDEVTHFSVVGDPQVKALILPNYTSSHEGLYTTAPWSEMKEGDLMDMPALLTFRNGTYLAITEAALLDYAGMYLVKENGNLRGTLSPWPGQTEIKVKMSSVHRSPWRVMLISDRVGALIESNIITSLNAPSKIDDVRWIKPGMTTFPWWNGNIVPDTLNAPGNNFVTQQYYIDFCARNGIGYHSVVEYGLHQWYVDDGVGFQPGPHSDVTKAVPGLDMKEVCDYAHSKGVGVRVWVHWAALYPKLDAAFEQFEKWGLNGMMIDFMDRDDQQMVNMQTEMLEKAAKHHLHVQFHGAYKPTGLHRTWPNELTREGTLNYEVNKWTHTGLSPDHDLDVVFTRMLAGSTDYHLGGFRAVTGEKYRLQYTRPLVVGTRTHMMAMYIVLESYLGMMCDYPDAYEGQPGFEFISSLPTVWDETRVIDAVLGEYIIVARREGTDWYIGGIGGSKEHNVQFSLPMLTSGSHEAVFYTDGAETATDPNKLSKTSITMNASKVVSVRISPGGGFCMHVR